MQLEAQLADKNVTIELSETARKYLAEKGYDVTMGARPLGRIIQSKIKRPLAEEILFGTLEKGGVAIIDYKDGELEFTYEADNPKSRKKMREKVKAK